MSTPAETSIIHRGEATSAEWKAFITAKHSGEVVEIDRAMFDYWLNVLPVKGMYETVTIKGVTRIVDFLQAEGYEELCAFWHVGSGATTRYFCQQTNIINPEA